jgi:alkanesulfonate monooxygenase SsuD/methylene tetrahydromethanopterin reductase-like flavin-dependent oxidoreductase (luciferase family)
LRAEYSMKFSMIFEAQIANPTPERERQLIHDCLEQAVFAETMGFDRIWAVEHHALRRYAHMSAPEIFLAAVAARTSRIRIGHGVVCMPFNYNYPTRVAERAAMLDIISNGRLDLGAGRGGTLQELSLCNVDPDRTYLEVEEALKIISHVWLNDTFEWHGDLLTIKAPEGNPMHSIVPGPVQRPHPPLYLACTRPDTVIRAAEWGVGALVFGYGGIESVRAQRQLYDKTRAERTPAKFVSTVVNDHFSALCPTIVLDDRERARQIGVRGQRFFAEAISHWARPGMPEPNDHTEDLDNIAHMRGMKAKFMEEAERSPELKAQLTIASSTFNIDHGYGNAADAIDYVERLIDAGSDEIMCLIQMGTIPQDVCMETIRIWGEKVIPHFRRQRNAA